MALVNEQATNRFLNISLTDLVNGNFAYFSSYRNNIFYYNIDLETDTTVITFQFIIPLEETAGATFNAREKALTLMRWIRKAKETGELVILGQTRKNQ